MTHNAQVVIKCLVNLKGPFGHLLQYRTSVAAPWSQVGPNWLCLLPAVGPSVGTMIIARAPNAESSHVSDSAQEGGLPVGRQTGSCILGLDA